jgi:hypothetical protein
MNNSKYWQKQDRRFLQITQNAVIPNQTLRKVDYINLKTERDLFKIPEQKGCYWIWTNEKVVHSFHTDVTPDKITAKIKGKITSGEIIYNGLASGNIQARIFNHLYSKPDAGRSGISLDLYFKTSKSHRKKAMATKGKVPYIGKTPIRDIETLLNLFLSKEESFYIKSKQAKVHFFRNGINFLDGKHKKHKYRVYYISGIDQLYAQFIEKKWREKYGRPKLCSYKSGR